MGCWTHGRRALVSGSLAGMRALAEGLVLAAALLLSVCASQIIPEGVCLQRS